MEDEWRIIEKVVLGDVSAFEEIIRTYKSHVFRMVANMVSSQEVEEVAHEVFVRAFRCLSGYRREAPFEHWLSRIATRTCYDFWRRERRRRVIPLSDKELQELEREVLELRESEASAVERAKEILDWALAHLAPDDRLAFSLLYLQGLSMKETGEALGWSLAKVKVRTFRARKILRKLLTEDRT